MYDNARSEILDQLERLINIYPEQRAGQILFNYVFSQLNGEYGKDIFYLTDEELRDYLKDFADKATKDINFKKLESLLKDDNIKQEVIEFLRCQGYNFC